MKLLLTLLPALLTQTTGRRNQRIVIGFLLFTTVLVALFSIVFHQIMAYEGRDYSYITGVYWTLTVMSTLGFGDITFTSDIGKFDPKGGEAVTVGRACDPYGHRTQSDYPRTGSRGGSPLPPEASASLVPCNRFQYFPCLLGVLFDLGDEGVGAGKGDFAAQAFDEGDFKMFAVKIRVEIEQVRLDRERARPEGRVVPDVRHRRICV